MGYSGSDGLITGDWIVLKVPSNFDDSVILCWQTGIRMRWNRYFTACGLTQVSYPDQSPYLKCWNSEDFIAVAIMVLSQILQWWILFRWRLSFCQQTLNFHFKQRELCSSSGGREKLKSSIPLQKPSCKYCAHILKFSSSFLFLCVWEGAWSCISECLELAVLLFMYHCKTVIWGF